MKTEINLPVRYYETDQMGIVHHSNYIRYFECARSIMMVECGCPMEKCEAEGVTFPVVSVECRYKHPAKMGDVIRVVAQVDELPLAKLYVKQAVYNQDGVLCAEGKVVVGFLNKETGRPIRCPESVLEAFRAHMDEQA